jgi:amino acid permease
MSSVPSKVMTFGKVLMLISLFLAVPLNMFPARESLFEAFKIEKSGKNYKIITLVLMCSSTTIAITFQKVNSYFGLLGGTAGMMMAGEIPSLCYFKLKPSLTAQDKMFMVICALVTVVAGAGAILSAVNPQ